MSAKNNGYSTQCLDLPSSVHQSNFELSALETVLIAATLQDSIDQLDILSSLHTVQSTEADLEYSSLKERFETCVEKKRIFSRTAVPTYITPEFLCLQKIHKDQVFVRKVIATTASEVRANKTFLFLQEAVTRHETLKAEEKKLIKSQFENSLEVKRLRNQINHEASVAADALEQRNEMIAYLKDQVQDGKLHSSLEKKYVTHWEEARTSQQRLDLQLKEERCQKMLKKNTSNYDSEVRAHYEIDSYLRIVQDDLEKMLQTMKQRYEFDIEDKDYTLLRQKADRKDLLKELRDLEKRYEKHKAEMEEYKAYKEKCRQKEELEERRNRMATNIQAWWRGVMVRRGLGAYRKKKKDKKKGKKPNKG